MVEGCIPGFWGWVLCGVYWLSVGRLYHSFVGGDVVLKVVGLTGFGLGWDAVLIVAIRILSSVRGTYWVCFCLCVGFVCVGGIFASRCT